MKTILALTLAGATLAAASGALAATGKIENRISVAASRHAAPAPGNLMRKCNWPRISVRGEYLKLGQAGYRKIKYLSKGQFLPRCAKFIYFNACMGANRYKLIVRYINQTRYVVVLNQGNCINSYRSGAYRG